MPNVPETLPGSKTSLSTTNVAFDVMIKSIK